jgi:hypothetical protein
MMTRENEQPPPRNIHPLAPSNVNRPPQACSLSASLSHPPHAKHFRNHPPLSHMTAFFEAKRMGVCRVAPAKSLFRLPNHFHLRSRPPANSPNVY